MMSAMALVLLVRERYTINTFRSPLGGRAAAGRCCASQPNGRRQMAAARISDFIDDRVRRALGVAILRRGLASSPPSAVDHLLRALGVAVSVHRDPRGGRVDLPQVVQRELDV